MKRMTSPSAASRSSTATASSTGFPVQSPKPKGKGRVPGEGSLPSREKFLADSIPTASWNMGQILLLLGCPSAGIPVLGTADGTSVPLRQDRVGVLTQGPALRQQQR